MLLQCKIVQCLIVINVHYMAHNQRIDNTFRLKNSQIVIKNRGYPSTRPSLPPEYPVPKFWTRLSPNDIYWLIIKV